MAWIRTVCGRLGNGYRYSGEIVYNNFPWPEPTPLQIQKIEEAAQKIIDARVEHPESTLAQLYNPLTMPANLHKKAHTAMDALVDKAYRKEPFTSEVERIQYLFERYSYYIEKEAQELATAKNAQSTKAQVHTLDSKKIVPSTRKQAAALAHKNPKQTLKSHTPK